MPNWCSNSLSIHNPKVFKEKCVKAGIFQFDNFILMPEHLKLYSHELCMSESDEERLSKAEITHETLKGEMPNECFCKGVIDFLCANPWLEAEEERTGVKKSDWYDWNLKHYGTKWDLAEDDADLSELDECIKEDMQFDLFFDTAWSPPLPVLEKMAELGVEFDWHCEEGGCGIFMEGNSNGESFSCWDCDAPEGYYED